MVPVMRYLLTNPDCFEYYEQAHEMLGIFTYYRPEPLSQELWELFIITVENFELQVVVACVFDLSLRMNSVWFTHCIHALISFEESKLPQVGPLQKCGLH